MFYKLNGSRVTLREFWWETKLFVWVALLVKLFKIRIRGSTDDLAVDSLRPFLVNQSQVRPEMLDRFAPTLRQLTAMGFGAPIWHDEEDVYQATRNTIATMLHSSSRALVRVQCRTNFGRVPAKVKFFATFISKTPGGFIVTGNGRRDMSWPKSHATVRLRGMPVDQVWAEHQRRMTAAVQPISANQLLDVAEEYHASLRDFHLQRGVFEPLGEDELAMTAPAPPGALVPAAQVQSPDAAQYPANAAPDLLAVDAPVPAVQAQAPDLMEIATLDELRRLQNSKMNWRSSAVLLIASAGLFILYFRGADHQQNWEYLAMVVGILLFHELGHYLAMRILGYRNVRMFFIPGFGAAVAGRHYNAPAWKKIVVSLMGPLPGILAGIICLAMAALMYHRLLYTIGLLAIVINAFNLIPVLPLDGGWVAHAALFSRHPKLDVGFRIVTALILLLIGYFLPGSQVLMYLAIVMFVGLPVAYRQAIIVSELRAMPQLGISPDNQTIPLETARIILSKIRQRVTRGLNARLAAKQVASVFESLNARPPSVGATVGLLSLHAFGFVLGLGVTIVALGINGRSLFHRPQVRELQYGVTENQIGTAPQAPTSPRNIVIARFRNVPAACELLGTLPATRSASQFGQTVMVAFAPAEMIEQHELFNRFSKIADDVFVQSSQMAANVQLSFTMPDTAAGKQSVAELEAYLEGLPGAKLIPPWADETVWPVQQRAEETQLRLLLKQLQDPSAVPRFNLQRQQQIEAAQRSGDSAEADRLMALSKQEIEDAQRAHQQQLQQQFGHADFIRQWEQINQMKDWPKQNARMKQEIQPQLGQWPDGKPTDLLVTTGTVFDSGNDVRVFCTFNQTDTGLPAMAHWLFRCGATKMRYQITGVSVQPLETDDEPN